MFSRLLSASGVANIIAMFALLLSGIAMWTAWSAEEEARLYKEYTTRHLPISAYISESGVLVIEFFDKDRFIRPSQIWLEALTRAKNDPSDYPNVVHAQLEGGNIESNDNRIQYIFHDAGSQLCRTISSELPCTKFHISILNLRLDINKTSLRRPLNHYSFKEES